MIRSLALLALSLTLGVGPLLAELCESRCAQSTAAGTPVADRAVDQGGCPHASGGGTVVTIIRAPHACVIHDVTAATLRHLDWSSVLVTFPTSSFDHITLDGPATLLRIESRHRPRGSPSAAAQLRI